RRLSRADRSALAGPAGAVRSWRIAGVPLPDVPRREHRVSPEDPRSDPPRGPVRLRSLARDLRGISARAVLRSGVAGLSGRGRGRRFLRRRRGGPASARRSAASSPRDRILAALALPTG